MDVFCYPNCCVCGSSLIEREFEFEYSSNEVLARLELRESPSTYLMHCRSCDHYFVRPQIQSKLISKYYEVLNSEYFDIKANVPPTDSSFAEHLKARKLVETRTKYGNILEIGCGYGYLIDSFDASCWKRYAVEPSPHAATHVRCNCNINIQTESFENSIFDDVYFDVILLFDVIEHLQDPQALFRKICRILKPGGFVYIGTGNIRSLNARMAKRNWAYFGSWEHISFFSRRSMKALLLRHNLKLIKTINRSYKGGVQNYWTFAKNIIKYLLSPIRNSDRKVSLVFDHVTFIVQKPNR